MKLIDTIKILALSAAVVTACQKQGMEDNSSVNSDVAPEAQFGTVAFSAQALETKVSVGDKVDGKYPGLWEENDAVKVVYADGTEAGTAIVDAETAGNNIWDFTLENVQVGAKARVVYPATAGFGATVTLPSAQTQSASSSSIGKYSYALSEEITTTADEPVKFTLNYFNAIIKINLKSTQYAAYDLKSVGFFSKGTALAGEFTVSDGVFVPGETTQDKVIVTLSEPASLENEQTVWMTAFPTDLTDKEVYVVATLVKDGKELVVPVEFAGAPLLAGKVNVLNVELSAEKAVQWYVGDDPRNMLGYYAYGAANTVMWEKIKGNTSKIVNYIDVRARGDFYQVTKPVYYGLLTRAEMGRELLMINDSNESVLTPNTKVSDDYTIAVQVYNGNNYNSRGSWGTVAIYDESHNLLWSFMVCTYFRGDEIKDIDWGSYGKFMDRALGQSFSADFMEANKEVLGTSLYTSAAYFQWGRKDPFMVTNQNLYTSTTNQMSIAESISRPYVLVLKKDSDWCITSNNDFWGFVSAKKTVFDPCPAGYKVPKTDMLRKIDSNDGKRQVDETKDKINYNFVINPQATEDKWLYTGMMWNDGASWSGPKLDNNIHTGYAYWANSESADAKGNMIKYVKLSSGAMSTAKNDYKVRGAAVRCVKE